MTSQRDVDRLLDRWLGEGPTQVADRVLDSVADRIGSEPQLPGWRVTWRESNVNRYLMPIAGVAAAAVVVAVVGYNFLAQQPSVGGPAPSPTPTSTPAPSPTAAPTPTPDSKPRTTTYRPFDSALTVTFALPDGWSEFQNWAVIGPADSTDPAGVSVVFVQAEGIYSDPCRWDILGTRQEGQPGDLAVGADALDLATALHTNTAYTSTGAPTPVSIGSQAGYTVEIQVPADVEVETCDVPSGDQSGAYVVFGGEYGGFYPQGPGNRWQVSVVDVGDVQVIVVLSSFAGTSAADMAAARSIVESIRFTP